jgi:hypothetical protein
MKWSFGRRLGGSGSIVIVDMMEIREGSDDGGSDAECGSGICGCEMRDGQQAATRV